MKQWHQFVTRIPIFDAWEMLCKEISEDPGHDWRNPPDDDEGEAEYHADEAFLQALRCGDITAWGYHWKPDDRGDYAEGMLEEIPEWFWFSIGKEWFWCAINEDTEDYKIGLPPHFEEHYDDVTVGRDDFFGLLSRSGETPRILAHHSEESAQLRRAVGGRPPQYNWDEIWFRVAKDLYNEGQPASIAELVMRVQKVCRDHGIREPSEETLRPKARRLFNIMREGETGAAATPLSA